jgi:hypothetical protein
MRGDRWPIRYRRDGPPLERAALPDSWDIRLGMNPGAGNGRNLVIRWHGRHVYVPDGMGGDPRSQSWFGYQMWRGEAEGGALYEKCPGCIGGLCRTTPIDCAVCRVGEQPVGLK